MSPSQAQDHLQLLGIPSTLGPYNPEDVRRVLRGQPVDPTIRETVHAKLSWVVGSQLVAHLMSDHPGIRWTSDRFAVRTLDHGESSASFLSFPDGSLLVLVSRTLQETFITMANVVERAAVTIGTAALIKRRRKRGRFANEEAARLVGVLRYVVLSQRLTGHAPPTLLNLDADSAELSGQLAAGAVMFAVAHEMGHIALGHDRNSTAPYGDDNSPTLGEIQELQADTFAFKLLSEIMADDPSMVQWSVFVALFARQITEAALYIRWSGTHPRAWARWGMLEQQVGPQDQTHERVRALVMAATGGALTSDDRLPPEMWQLLWADPMLSIDPSITPDRLVHWDFSSTAHWIRSSDLLRKPPRPPGGSCSERLRKARRQRQWTCSISVHAPRLRSSILRPHSASSR